MTIGGWLFIPPLLSVYNYGQRIKRSQRLVGVPADEQINPTLAFLLSFPFGILIIPLFVHYWYVTEASKPRCARRWHPRGRRAAGRRRRVSRARGLRAPHRARCVGPAGAYQRQPGRPADTAAAVQAHERSSAPTTPFVF